MEGMRLVWNTIGAFISGLPSEVVMIATFAFVGAVILGLMRWLT